ncbi:MAG TPA: SDR family oxidoreductase [Pyrinomonadaceae bacterium]|jgi:NAD(P)-dependent dehydrogenase (short-subunit alcohol dehydrogenase family)|nr:SDR family oxidoreductase [Pyrinomonadaceae bacterium]
MSLMTKSLSEQVALVTGGGTGIGRAFASALASAGARVVIASRDEAKLRSAADELNSSVGAERVFTYAFDVRAPEECEALVGHCVERFGSLDVLVNNSGLAVPETVDEITEEGWETVLSTNLKGAMWLVRAALPHMESREFGDIVNVSSQAGKHGYADVPSYCASKWGLLGFAESVRDHVRKTGANVRVFNFCPGLVDVENTAADAEPRPGFVHVSNMARTLLYALSLDRNVVLEDINIYSRG